MRPVFEEEEEIAPSDPRRNRGEDRGQDRELTISSTTLLAIFFGLVLICGLFFGLGYTLGRRAPSEASQLPSAAVAADPQPSSASKPSAASQPAQAAAPADPLTTDPGATPPDTSANSAAPSGTSDTSASPAQPAIVKPALTAVLTQPAEAAPASSAASPAAAPAAVPSAGTMVQIAAISNPADADVLVSALQKRGYSVSARRFTGDPLIHVQVGPFSNRADAIAMRQKLLSDGYNAILK
jgi:cell division protein FtsN